MLALVYLHAQSKLDAVGDVQPVEGLTAKLGQTPVVLPTSLMSRNNLSVCYVNALCYGIVS